jgi:hypothetical protein
MSDRTRDGTIEIWKDVVGYEGLYEVSNFGNIYSHINKKILKNSKNDKGRYSVELFKNGKSKRLLVHRLVMIAFVPNPDNFPQVNHMDENPSNNMLNNLEWCTPKYNMNYGEVAKTRHSKIDYSTEERKALARINGKCANVPVLQKNKKGEILMKFDSIKDATKHLKVNQSHIVECCKGQRKTSHGFMWEYAKRKDGDDLSESQ